MALPSTMLRFGIDLSDTDRGKYEHFEFRIARHPSESAPYLLTRVIAYALNHQDGIAFSGGVDNPDEPTVCVKDLTGTILLWIDIGNPSAKRLHKAAKAAKQVRVYTAKDPQNLLQEIAGEKIHNAQAIEVFSLAPSFISQLEKSLERDNTWQFLHDDGELSITANDISVSGELKRLTLG